MKYLSIDIETGGLDETKHPIIEFAAVLDDLADQRPVESLPYFRCLLWQPEYAMTPFCVGMHQKLMAEIERRKGETGRSYVRGPQEDCVLVPGAFQASFAFWASSKLREYKANIAGKNYASFDHRFLSRPPYNIQDAISIHHRVIDVASCFWQPGDTCLPDTNTCIKRAGLTGETDHSALGDARTVVQLVRKALSRE